MKNLIYFLSSLLLTLGFNANAADIINYDAVPSSYGTVIEVEDEDGLLVKEVKYKSAGTAWSAGRLNAVLNAYGRALSVESSYDAPTGFAKVGIVVDPDTGVENEAIVRYGQSGIVWRPKALHQILTAYGLTPDYEKATEQLPKEYARVIEVEDQDTGELVEALQFKSGAVAWRASALAKIIDAYQIGNSI